MILTLAEYDDDTELIQRSTSVIARRLPAMKRGHGRAARYVTGRAPVNAKNQSRKEQPGRATKATAAPRVVPQIDPSNTEEQNIEAMFAAQKSGWADELEAMAK